MTTSKNDDSEIIKKFQQLYFSAFKNDRLTFSANKMFHRKIHNAIPFWHIEMLRDQERNDFYYKAIKAGVKNKTVFEVGSGFGYLSLLCAELGAKHVYTCEENPIIYNYAVKFIKENQLESKITIFNKNSQKLKLKKDLAEKVDIILSEIFSADIFSEGLLRSLEDAKRFLKDQGRFIPEKLNLIENYLQLENDNKDENELTKFLRVVLLQRLHGVQWELKKHKVLSKKKITSIDLSKCHESFILNHKLNLPKTKEKAKDVFFVLSFEIVSGKNKYNSLGEYDTDSTRHWSKMSSLIDLAINNKEELTLIYEKNKWDIN